MKWAHDKAKCGKCGKRFYGLSAEDSVQKHQNAKHGGKGKILYYDTKAEEWEE